MDSSYLAKMLSIDTSKADIKLQTCFYHLRCSEKYHNKIDNGSKVSTLLGNAAQRFVKKIKT